MSMFSDWFRKEQPGVGDVHTPGAGGKKGRGKAKPFSAIMAGQADEETTEAAPDDEAAEKFSLKMDVTKVDADKQQIFGWASVTHIDGKEVIDKQDEAIDLGHLEAGAYDFALHSREQGDMHSKRDAGRMIESMMFTPEKAAVGITAKNDKGQSLMGWWTGWQVSDPHVWSDIKAGRRPELSIGGRASSEPM